VPELPEVEHLRRTLEPVLCGALVKRVEINRRDVIHRYSSMVSPQITQQALLAKVQIDRLERRGKQLGILSSAKTAISVHLGMTGRLMFVPRGASMDQLDHIHCIWHIDSPHGPGKLIFRDPRRFGGIWVYPSIDSLIHDRWSQLGPDALTTTTADLANRLSRAHRPIKAALLDQTILAGVGNIYADESLFTAGVHPWSIASALPRPVITALTKAIRSTLGKAIHAGGSTLRDYRDANGQPGWFAVSHRVYGRAGKPCMNCAQVLEKCVVAQRTTVVCSSCQQRYD